MDKRIQSNVFYSTTMNSLNFKPVRYGVLSNSLMNLNLKDTARIPMYLDHVYTNIIGDWGDARVEFSDDIIMDEDGIHVLVDSEGNRTDISNSKDYSLLMLGQVYDGKVNKAISNNYKPLVSIAFDRVEFNVIEEEKKMEVVKLNISEVSITPIPRDLRCTTNYVENITIPVDEAPVNLNDKLTTKLNTKLNTKLTNNCKNSDMITENEVKTKNKTYSVNELDEMITNNNRTKIKRLLNKLNIDKNIEICEDLVDELENSLKSKDSGDFVLTGNLNCSHSKTNELTIHNIAKIIKNNN